MTPERKMREKKNIFTCFRGKFPTDLGIFAILTIVQEKFSHFWFHIRRKKEFHLLIGVRYPVELSANCHGRYIYGLRMKGSLSVCKYFMLLDGKLLIEWKVLKNGYRFFRSLENFCN